MFTTAPLLCEVNLSQEGDPVKGLLEGSPSCDSCLWAFRLSWYMPITMSSGTTMLGRCSKEVREGQMGLCCSTRLTCDK